MSLSRNALALFRSLSEAEAPTPLLASVAAKISGLKAATLPPLVAQLEGEGLWMWGLLMADPAPAAQAPKAAARARKPAREATLLEVRSRGSSRDETPAQAVRRFLREPGARWWKERKEAEQGLTQGGRAGLPAEARQG